MSPKRPLASHPRQIQPQPKQIRASDRVIWGKYIRGEKEHEPMYRSTESLQDFTLGF